MLSEPTHEPLPIGIGTVAKQSLISVPEIGE